MKTLFRIYLFLILVGGSAFFGIVLGLVAAIINSLLFLHFFQADVDTFLSLLTIIAPILIGINYGFKAFCKHIKTS